MINPFTEVKGYLIRNRIEKGVAIERSLAVLREQSIQRKLAYDEDKTLHIQRLKAISERSDLKKGGVDELGFIKDRILEKLATLEKGYMKETIDTVKMATQMKRELESIYKDEKIKKSVSAELNRDRIGTAYETVLEAFKQKKIDKEAFKEIRKNTEGKLGEQVHYSDMIVRDVMGRILLLRRADSDDDPMSGQWGLPGGHIDPGEDYKEAAIRELHEEAAIEVKPEGVYHVGELTNPKAFIQFCEVYVDYIPVVCINTREHSDYEWVNVYDLLNYDLVGDLRGILKKVFAAELDPKVVEVRKAFNTILTAYFNDKISEKVVEDTYGVYLEKSEKLDEKKKKKLRLVLREFKEGNLKSSSGDKVIDRKQAIAIAMSEAGLDKVAEDDLNEDQDQDEDEVKRSIDVLIKALEYGQIKYDDLSKSMVHKYIKRKWKDGKWEYIYDEPKKNEGKFDVELEKIKSHAKRIIEGTEHLERLSPAEERGCIEGGRRNVEATILCSAVQGSDSTERGDVERVAKEQEKRLEQYARSEGIWVDYYGQKKFWDFLFQGGEAKVYREDDNTLKKVVEYAASHETPLEYLDRISLHNYLFPNVAYKLIGFCHRYEDLQFIVTQPLIKNARYATSEEIKLEMEHMGFTSVGETKFINKNYIIEDLTSRNVLRNEQGEMFFIDGRVMLNKKVAKSLEILELAYSQGKIPLDVLEKARSGVYKDTAENRKLARVGQKFGETKKRDTGWYERFKQSEERGKELDPIYQKIADKIKKKIEDAGFKVHGISKSNTEYGKSWYIKLTDNPNGDQIRLSDHEVGEKRLWNDPTIAYVNYTVSEDVLDKIIDNSIKYLEKKKVKLAELKVEREKADKEYKSFDEERLKVGEKFDKQGLGVAETNRTYQDLETIKAKHPDWTNIYQQKLDGGAFNYIFARPKDAYTSPRKITKEYLEHLRGIGISKSILYEVEGLISEQTCDRLIKSNDGLFLDKVIDIIEKARTGIYADTSENRKLKRVGQKYGIKGQQEQGGSKQNNVVDGDAKKEKKEDKEIPIEEHAKTASGSALETAAKEASDPEVRTAAHNELDRRSKEEAVQEEKSTEKEEKKDEGKGENKHLEKFRTLSDEQIKFYLDAPYPEVKEAAQLVADERGLKVVSKEDYIKSFEDMSAPNGVEEANKVSRFYKEGSKRFNDYIDKEENENIKISINQYKGNGFRDVRNFLTDSEKFKKEEHTQTVKAYEKTVKDISKLIQDNKIDKDLCLNRRVLIDSNFFTKLKEGDIYEDKSFSSTSLRELSQFGDFNIKILAKRGSSVANVGNSGEYEFLIDKDSKFRVLEKSKDKLEMTVELL